MKALLFFVAFLFACTIFSCKKSNNNSAALQLLQHKWMIISLNGEALRYTGMQGDYFDFATDNKLYRYFNNMHDTSVYNLYSNGQTLSLYQITNGVKSNTPDNYHVGSLNDSQLIISFSSGSIFAIDSLKR